MTPCFSAPVHSAEAYSPNHVLHHNGNSTGDRKFDSNMSYFLILIKICSILVYIHFVWFFCPFTSVGDEWEDECTPFGPKSFEVHPTHSQCVLLPMMGFEYINGLPPIHEGPLRPLVGIMAHLVVNGLLINSFSSKGTTHT